MAKKSVLRIVLLAVVVLVVIGAVWGKQYYDDRYVGFDYYAMVPLDYDMTPEKMYTMKGDEAGLGKGYTLTAYNEQGESRTVEFNVYKEDSADFPQPGTFLYIKASRQAVVGWSVTDESRVPEGALSKLKR